MKASVLDSLIFELLTKTCCRKENFWARLWWKRVYATFSQRHRTVRTTIHGRKVLANFGYTYPFVSRLYRSFNAPLLELVHTVYQLKQRPVRLVDVGAAIGDTVLFVNSNCPRMVSEYVCIDGDSEFFEYLMYNLSFLPNVRYILHQLSRSAGYNSALVRTHAGTASAQGTVKVRTDSLEEVLKSHAIGPVDVLKIDVDGFDGEVLAGAETILKNDKPGVIFEWHPILCKRTNNNWNSAFEALEGNGYRRSAWFTKFGTFSHFASLDDVLSLRDMAEFCLTTTAFEDWHYDILCLPGDDASLLRAAAELQFASRRRSTF